MKTFKIMDLYFSAAPGPSDWYIKWERCGGNRQSPINIDTTRVRERKYRTLKIEFDNSGGLVAGDLENNGNYPTFSVDKSKGTARLKGSRLTDTYVLKGSTCTSDAKTIGDRNTLVMADVILAR